MMEEDLNYEMWEYCCPPVMRRIASVKNLLPSQRRRLKRLNEIFKEEGRLPLSTSVQEMRYLFRLEANRRRYRKKRWVRFHSRKEWKEWEEAVKRDNPLLDRPIEEILDLMTRKRDEHDKPPEK